MSAPTNVTRLLAETITLPYAATTNVTDSGTTYETWWKFVASADGIVKIWGYGGLDGYMPWVDVFENSDVALYLNLGEEWRPINVPIYMPVTAGNTYYLNLYMLALPFSAVASLALSVAYVPAAAIQEGDFLTNLEVDTDAERPMCVLRGDTDQAVRLYKQMVTPTAVRGNDGLPHGVSGVVWANGNVAWGDDQYSFIKIYDKALDLVATISDYVGAFSYQSLGFSRTMQRMYVAYDAGATVSFDAWSAAGVLLDTWPTTEANFVERVAVNADESILYYSNGGVSTIKRWDLINAVALADFAPDAAGYDIADILVLEDDTVLALYHDEGTVPSDVYVKHYSAAGATLHTYSFGDFYRGDLNPPRIGFALDSPTHFWITLKPNARFDVSQFKKVKISDGSYTTEREHVNYLSGVYLGGLSPTLTFSNTSNGASTIVNTTGFDQDLVISILIKETFANGTGTQLKVKVGTNIDDDIIAPESSFTNAVAGTNMSFPYTLPAGQSVIVTRTARTGTGTGAMVFGKFNPDTLGPLGSEKAYPLLLATLAATPTPPPGPGSGTLYTALGTPIYAAIPTQIIVCERTTPIISDENVLIRHDEIELDCITGESVVDATASELVVQMQYSDNSGHTWSSWLRGQLLGEIGDYTRRVRWTRLGSARNRVYRVRIGSNGPVTLINAYGRFQRGNF